SASASAEDWFAGYHLYRDHVEWLKAQIRDHPTIARPFSAGKSFQGRYQAGIKIGSGPHHVVFHGLQHSREWITGSVVEYLIYQLLVGTDTRVAGYLKKYTFHIIPIMNPDGFIITQTTDRLHRKNAQREGDCLGTDINRNWNFHWNETSNDASSTDPCAYNYRGPKAFSTPEATNIARYLKSLPNVASYMDFHSYAQLLLTPYGYTSVPPANYDSYLKPLADGAVKALEAVHGTHFQAGDIYHTIYPASGSSIDYAMGEANVSVPFGFELRDTGLFGFILPAVQIIPSGQETWAAFTFILDNLR
ncbi:MAG: carboxypeptidase A1, partial [Linnemannia gamsii]